MRAIALARCVALALATTLLPGPAGLGFAPVLAGDAQDAGLAAGIRQVDEGDFEGAVTTLGPVADRLSARGGHDAAQACLYLGIAHLALDQRDAARARFREALAHEPSLRLGTDRFSPKVIAAFEEARREREAAAPTAGTEPTGQSRAQGGGHAGRTALIAGGAAAVGVGIALAVTGGGTTSSDGTVTLTAARFGTPALECPNGSLGLPLAAAIDVDARNDTGSDLAIGAVSAVLTIVASPGAPGEVGFASGHPATVVPATLRSGTSTVRVQTTLTCGNGAGDAPRYNDWKGRVTLATAGEAHVVETVDTMRVNIP